MLSIEPTDESDKRLRKLAVKVAPEQTTLTPFLKWPGGKRWFIKQYASILPERFNRYIEPFLGSGAVYFYLAPEKAILTDVNAGLINTYNIVRDYSTLLEDLLQFHHNKHSSSYYYFMRDVVPEDPVKQAARFIYLNRTCWNGLYRVNKRGEFNVPIGTKSSVLLDSDNFTALSGILRSAKILIADFEESINLAGKGDFLFVDPPYTVKHNNNGFLKYNEHIFSWSDQVRLAESLLRASRRGAQFIMTNADHVSVRELYSNFSCYPVSRHSVLAGNTHDRGLTTELVVTTNDISESTFTSMRPWEDR